MDKTVTFTRVIRVNHRRGFNAADEWRTHTVRIEVDVDDIATMLGTKAARSKGKRAREIGGAVRVLAGDANG